MPGEIAVVTPGMSTKNGAAGNVVTVKALREDLRKKAEEVSCQQSKPNYVEIKRTVLV